MPNIFINDAQDMYEQGNIALQEGRLEDALECFHASVALAPTVDALLGLGILMITLKPGTGEGINALERAHALAADDERVATALGGAYLACGDAAAAIAFLREHLSRNPGQPISLLTLSEAYAAAGQMKQAEKTLKQAIRLAPDHPEVHLAASWHWLQENKLDKALSAAQQAIQLAPQKPKMHLMLGVVLAAQERFAEALPEIQVMLDADPAFTSAQVSKAMVLYHLGQENEALALLQQVQQDNENDPDSLHSLAIFYFSVNMLTQARALLQQEIALDPDFPAAYDLLYQIAEAMGDSAAMQEAYRGLLRTASQFDTDNSGNVVIIPPEGQNTQATGRKAAGRTGHKKNDAVQAIYTLKITLKGIHPPIWRRVLVPDTITLADLHHIIQAAMGWYDEHLHEFTAGRTHYGIPDGEDGWFSSFIVDERRTRLCDLAREVRRLSYSYDFGDGWEHQILIEKVLPPDPTLQTPVCLKGKRACPPEISGARGTTSASSKPSRTPRTSPTMKCLNGLAANSIPKPAIWSG